ncbi:MAG: glycosyltransferase family 2 protein [Anaerolineae bacterium]|nr:glycosyltransferase family 2 protein [Anaerolineae bacterium]
MARLEWDSPTQAPPRAKLPGGRSGDGDAAPTEWTVDPLALTQERHLRLDAITDPHHWSYKIAGMLVLAALLAFLAVAIYDPDNVFWVVQVLGLYLLLRFLMVVVFYPVGQMRIRRLQRRAPQTAAEGRAIPRGLTAPVHHVVILANFKEPEEVVARTLERLGEQDNARETLTVVMAMEEAEAGSRAKGERLKARFGAQFAHMLVTVHPAGLPDESPGKAANQSWAAKIARDYLVYEVGMPLDSLTVTSCDADSLIHAGYFSELTRQFAADPRRHERIWQAPFRFNNNIWRSPAPIRLLGFLNNMVQVSELSNPIAVNLPLSTYTLSYRLAEDIGYWDEMVIAEDWHIFLRALFGTGGRVTLEPIFLPTSGDSVVGATIWQAFRIFYKQRVRHAWGASDIGYMFQQWNRWPDVPLGPKMVYLAKVLHDHIIFTVAGLLLGIGSIVMVLQHGFIAVAAPIPGFYTVTLQSGNLLSAGGTLAAWLYEHLTSRRASPGWRPIRLLLELLTWPLLAPVTLLLVIAPTFEAQFRQMFGGDLVFWRTPKKSAH